LKNNFTKWTSGNKKIDNLIQEMQLKIDSYQSIIFEWIPFNQFINIKEIGKGGFAIVYSAIWKDGPLCYDSEYGYIRNNWNKDVALKCLYNSQNISSEFLNEVNFFIIILYNKI
jgi:serine/threonine protein kinase